MNEQTSQLRFYSLGIVTEDKPEKNNKIKVMPIEAINLVDGMIKDIKIDYDVSAPDHKGVTKTDNIKGEAVVVADWITIGNSNRLNAPEVYRNETVMIFQMSDTDKFYWTPIFLEPGLRKLEVVVIGASNVSDPSPTKAFDKDSSYWLEFNTRTKAVQLHTSKNDGESFTYDITIDAKNSNVQIKDDAGNYILMDTKNDRLSMTSVAGANVDLDQGHIKMHGKTITMTADSKITMTAPETEINSETQHNGNFSVKGGISATAGMNITGGGGKISGDLETTGGNVTLQGGNITMTGGSITANGEDLSIDLT